MRRLEKDTNLFSIIWDFSNEKEKKISQELGHKGTTKLIIYCLERNFKSQRSRNKHSNHEMLLFKHTKDFLTRMGTG